jgi:hypothetical protein
MHLHNQSAIENEYSLSYTHSNEYKCHTSCSATNGCTGGKGRRRQAFGTAASNESIVPTYDDTLIQTIIEMVTVKEKSKWPVENLPSTAISTRTIMGLHPGEVKNRELTAVTA